MLNKVSKYIDDYNLFESNQKLIVGLSGGADSMALIVILIELGYNCIAAHCNFHLRGQESDDDATFVSQWCREKDIKLATIDFDTHQYAHEKKISIEMAARELRYEWFEQVRTEHQADYIAVAHHENDSVETVLINMIRGTGISGLTGIMPKNGRIVRPLLSVNRNEIEHYLRSKSIEYRTDSTNLKDIYMRNYIRLNVLPMLEKLNPSIYDSIIRTSNNLAEVEKIYRSHINDDINRVKLGDRININSLRKTISPKSVLFEILSPLGFTASVIDDIDKSVDSTSGKVFYSNSHRLIKDRDCFILDEIDIDKDDVHIFYIDSEESDMLLPLKMRIDIIPKSLVDIKKDKAYLYADADLLSFPLMLRKWKHGDWFIPFGMKGKKKVSDYFADHKFSLKDKENTWILTSGKDIVWIVGHRGDERFRVTNKTKRALIIELMK